MTDVAMARLGDASAMPEHSAMTISVERGSRGDWQVALPEDDGRLSCETLVDARWVAYLLAADRQPCQLVVRDAYHRVVDRELIAA